MYRHIHLNYFETGVDLLGDVSRASTDAVRAARQKALAGYSQRVSTELATYIEKVGFHALLRVWQRTC